MLVADVALDVVDVPRVGVRDDQRLRRQGADFFEAGRIDVREIEHDPEPLAFLHQFAAEGRQALRRRTAGGKNPARRSRVRPRVGERNGAQPQFVKDAQQIEIVAQRLGAFHREEKSDPPFGLCSLNIGKRPAEARGAA